mmetsp:Transcript_5639/g.16314  ORF Transcript_5639/g.16314 Transcript_5639/m.16314 type:complete len:99 (+) Transcript_5639:111-407(+)
MILCSLEPDEPISHESERALEHNSKNADVYCSPLFPNLPPVVHVAQQLCLEDVASPNVCFEKFRNFFFFMTDKKLVTSLAQRLMSLNPSPLKGYGPQY